MSGDIQEDLQLRTLRDHSLTMDNLLQITFQLFAPLVYQLLREVARDLLGGQQVLTHTILTYQLKEGRKGGYEGTGGEEGVEGG